MSVIRNPLICFQCNKYFETRPSLIRHQRDIHEPAKPRKTGPTNWNTRNTLIKHRKRKKSEARKSADGFSVPEIPKNDFKNGTKPAPVSPTPVSKRPVRERPKKREEPVKIEPVEMEVVQGWICKSPVDDTGKACMKTFTEREVIMEHIRDKHNDKGRICKVLIRKPKKSLDTQDGLPEAKSPVMQNSMDFKVFTFTCKLCPTFKTNSESTFEEHVEIEHTTDMLMAKAKVTNRSNLYSGKFRCILCSLRTKSSKILKLHLEKHALDDKVKFCLRFKGEDTSALPSLLRINGGEAEFLRFPCTFCPTGFSDYGHLETHIQSNHRILKNYKLVVNQYFRPHHEMHSIENG